MAPEALGAFTVWGWGESLSEGTLEVLGGLLPELPERHHVPFVRLLPHLFPSCSGMSLLRAPGAVEARQDLQLPPERPADCHLHLPPSIPSARGMPASLPGRGVEDAADTASLRPQPPRGPTARALCRGTSIGE